MWYRKRKGGHWIKWPDIDWQQLKGLERQMIAGAVGCGLPVEYWGGKK